MSKEINSATSQAALVQTACMQALEVERGVRVGFDSHGKAVKFRMACYSYRKRDRERNESLYDKLEPMYGKSAFDTLIFTIKEENKIFYVYIESGESYFDSADIEVLP